MSEESNEITAATEALWRADRLVQECLSGNQAAWSALIDKFKNLIFSIPLKYGLPQEDAADIFQAVCLELLSELPRLREPLALPAWISKVTYHKCFHLKREQQRFVVTDASDEEKRPDVDVAALPPDALAQLEREQMLRDTLAQLSSRCRQLVNMLFFEIPARPYREIAESLGVATGSIGFIRGRCLERLQKRLEEAGFA
jgi:RNA polymerase sigma factor (sigma-70 family)